MPIPESASLPSGVITRLVQATRPTVSTWAPLGRLSSSSTRRPGASGSLVLTKAPPRETFAQVSCSARKKGRPVNGSCSDSMVATRTGRVAWTRR